MKPTKKEMMVLKGFFLRGLEKVGFKGVLTPANVKGIVEAGYLAEQNFISEMHTGETDRAKKARQVLASEVYGEAVKRGTRERLLAHLEIEADDAHRKMVLGL